MSARAGGKPVRGAETLDIAELPVARKPPGIVVTWPPSPGPVAVPWRQRLTLSLSLAIGDAIETRRLFVLLPFSIIGGLVAYSQLPHEPSPWALLGVAILLVALLAASLAHIDRLRALVLLSAFWAGLCLLPVHGLLFGTPMLSFPIYGQYRATVDEILTQTATERRIVVSQLTPVGDSKSAIVARARLLVGAEPPLAPGDVIEARLRLAPIPGPVLPGAFDSQFHAYFSGIGAYGNVTGGLVLVSSGSGLDPTRAVENLRRAIASRIERVLTGASAAIGQAMVMGDQSLISDETRDVMAASGLAHVYSISGLHLSLVAGGVYAILRLLLASLAGWTPPLPVKKIAALGGIVTACFYLLLAGGIANVPALRSTLMLGLIFGAVLAGRRALTMRNVAIAALVIIVIDPASVFRASFQLSFAAVVALIGVYELPRKPPAEHRSWIGRSVKHIWVAALTSLIAGTATLLFSAYHFQQTAPLGVLGNVLVLPVVSVVIMPAAMASVLAMPFGLESPFLLVMAWGIERMLDIAALVAGWSAGLQGNPLLTPIALFIGLLAMAWFAFVRTYWRFAAPILAIPAILLFALDARPDVLIADTTRAVAVRSTSGLGLLAGKTGTFAVDVWSQYYQEDIADALDDAHCDSLACMAATDAFSISVVASPDAFAEDCARHDLIIARIPAPAYCRAQTQVIDARDLRAGGVQWLRWNAAAKAFDIRPAVPSLTRPWRAALR
ncbi:ComEC/Rec2 family competence protein [uncultured Devosia sp.]|uniref:ComEC/Rec2 family competence protein n=1 Tax=uncultured Devosia sp. TaxID=211434 RepID=UPI0035CBF59E